VGPQGDAALGISGVMRLCARSERVIDLWP